MIGGWGGGGGLAKGLSKGLSEGLFKGLSQGFSKGFSEGLSKGFSKGLSKGLSKGKPFLRKSVSNNFLRKSVSNEIGSTKTDKNFRLTQKQHLIFKNSSEKAIFQSATATPGRLAVLTASRFVCVSVYPLFDAL